MVSLRLLTFLFLLSNASKLVLGTEAGEPNQDQVPCEDETKTVPTTTTESPTTTSDPCEKFPGATPYRRQNGWWCSKMFYQDMQLNAPLSYERSVGLCTLNKLPYVSSLETEQEKIDYTWRRKYAMSGKPKPELKKVKIGSMKYGKVRTIKPFLQKAKKTEKSSEIMVSLRLLTFLVLLSNASMLVTGTGTENQDQIPCEDETKTVPTTTTEGLTTSGNPCEKFYGTTAYRRQNGWFCSKMFYQDMQLDLPMSYELGVALCSMNDLPYVSSLETEQEKKDYNWQNQDQVPCEDEVKTVPTTTENPTTSRRPCQNFPGSTGYKRQSGWWCTKLLYQDMQLPEPMSYKEAVDFCTLNELPYVSSLETEKEKLDYTWQTQDEVPCEDEPKTTTTAAPTTKKDHCPGFLSGATPFKRRNKWWCAKVRVILT
ncbi:hypothetical protein CAEBREN_11482 [Caenorhabditis brenneri]|uniref:Uncharacterized protein n=1 Tax=Caenorhabditis brenneri TaxID=135651 RepID=G0NE48_CAEBE|nr:hypothetical protein CAEBREN_11482 [Caenorhabditis brenneri]